MASRKPELLFLYHAQYTYISFLLSSSLRASGENEEKEKDQALIQDDVDVDDDDPEFGIGFNEDMGDMRKDCALFVKTVDLATAWTSGVSRLTGAKYLGNLELDLHVKVLDVEPTPTPLSQLDDSTVDKWAEIDNWSSEVTKMLPYDVPFTPPGKARKYNWKIVHNGTMHCEAGLLASLFYGLASESQDPDLVATAELEVFAKAFEDFHNGGPVILGQYDLC
ncbi:hypothetical protein B0H10DRAFT_1947063 [Mycena sp. CBHHK59/15]|nr:hypothetical protein B0H10DRAFT_1947063 [Mycena sp. CBHHK59/15]